MAVQNNKSAAAGCELISSELAAAGSFLNSRLDCPDARLKPFMDYLKGRHGKMLRASFVLLAGRLFGPANSLHIKIAGIVEMIHAATLLHDDVIDSGSQRRYHATANKLWGANFAVLLGDFLLSRVFAGLASLERSDINLLIAEMSAKICRGEMLQNACRGDFSISIEEYLDIIEKKSAIFFADCCRLGAMASNADEQSANLLYEFGLNFGMAFQIIDDLSDILNTESSTGKTAGRDFFTATPTLPIIHAFKTLDSSAKNELLNADKQTDRNRVISLLDSAKSIDFTKSEILQYQQKALASLDHFSPSSAASELKNLVSSINSL